MALDGMVRTHCGDIMEYLGVNSQGHGFGCKICDFIEYCKDPNAPTASDEKPRKNPLSYGYETKIGW